MGSTSGFGLGIAHSLAALGTTIVLHRFANEAQIAALNNQFTNLG
jgi:NAD(P)-dependent dehydrogenase (short-subunit alcohol dehydrogenase family)